MAIPVERPANPLEAAELIAAAAGDGRTIEIMGGGSKRGWGGGEAAGDLVLSTEKLNAVIDYDPIELVLTVQAGAKLTDIEALLDTHGQMLAFEPPDFGPVFGEAAGKSTIGGILAANLSGPRRLLAGAARDHFLGFEGVSGRGIVFKAGGKVVKNVTGFDLPKLMAGSWGTLALLTAVTLKVVPKPKASTTLLVRNLSPDQAVQAMTRAVSLPLSVSGAANQPDLTALRLEGFGPSVAARLQRLRGEMTAFGEVEVRDQDFTTSFWRDVGRLATLTDQSGELWRVSQPPAQGADAVQTAEILAALDPDVRWRMDWAGGLVWIEMPKSLPFQIDRPMGGGRWSRVRGRPDVWPSRSDATARLTARVRAAFDPAGVFLERTPLYGSGE